MTIMGMSVVDIHRWDRSMRCNHKVPITDNVDDVDIAEMSNMIAKPLRKGSLGIRVVKNRQSAKEQAFPTEPLCRIKGEDNRIVYPESGDIISMRCFVCRPYRRMPINTNWMCKECGMPLCRKGRKRDQTCLEEHQCSTNEYLGCGFIKRNKNNWILPEELKRYKRTRQEKKQSEGLRRSENKQLEQYTGPAAKRRT